MNIKELWQGFKTKKCENCKENNDCGRYKYSNLCSNINYLESFGEEYYQKMKNSFEELDKICNEKLNIFSFGCGCSLDYIAGREVFENEFSYFNIDECEWKIKDTDNYKKFLDNMPKENLSYKEGLTFLKIVPKNLAVCFFNSMYDILNNKSDLKNDLLDALENKLNFYILLNFTQGGNHTLAWREECFLNDLCKSLKQTFNLKRIEILSGNGIIILGEKK